MVQAPVQVQVLGQAVVLVRGRLQQQQPSLRVRTQQRCAELRHRCWQREMCCAAKLSQQHAKPRVCGVKPARRRPCLQVLSPDWRRSWRRRSGTRRMPKRLQPLQSAGPPQQLQTQLLHLLLPVLALEVQDPLVLGPASRLLAEQASGQHQPAPALHHCRLSQLRKRHCATFAPACERPSAGNAPQPQRRHGWRLLLRQLAHCGSSWLKRGQSALVWPVLQVALQAQRLECGTLLL